MIVSGDIDANRLPVRGASLLPSGTTVVTYGPAAGLHHDRVAGLRIGAELTVAGRRLEQFDDLLAGQLVGRDVLGDAHPRPVLAAGLQVRAVAPDARDDCLAAGPVARSGMEFTPRASISSSRWPTICFRPPDSAMPPLPRPSRRSRTR